MKWSVYMDKKVFFKLNLTIIFVSKIHSQKYPLLVKALGERKINNSLKNILCLRGLFSFNSILTPLPSARPQTPLILNNNKTQTISINI